MDGCEKRSTSRVKQPNMRYVDAYLNNLHIYTTSMPMFERHHKHESNNQTMKNRKMIEDDNN